MEKYFEIMEKLLKLEVISYEFREPVGLEVFFIIFFSSKVQFSLKFFFFFFYFLVESIKVITP